jgi:hypothetical protein
MNSYPTAANMAFGRFDFIKPSKVWPFFYGRSNIFIEVSMFMPRPTSCHGLDGSTEYWFYGCWDCSPIGRLSCLVLYCALSFSVSLCLNVLSRTWMLDGERFAWASARLPICLIVLLPFIFISTICILANPVFSHGQFKVVVSRVTSTKELNIFGIDETGAPSMETSYIKEVLEHLQKCCLQSTVPCLISHILPFSICILYTHLTNVFSYSFIPRVLFCADGARCANSTPKAPTE